jgi:hypothetical protein
LQRLIVIEADVFIQTTLSTLISAIIAAYAFVLWYDVTTR